ncbi:hypothetical protein ACFL6U_26635 [Planctomycetota bacterium]
MKKLCLVAVVVMSCSMMERILIASPSPVLINLDAKTSDVTPTVLLLEGGYTYNVTPVGKGTIVGGTTAIYDAWNAWGKVNLANKQGWLNKYNYAYGSVYQLVYDGIQYTTAAEALTNALSSSFTLFSDTSVGFFIDDHPLTDNLEGMSLLIEASTIEVSLDIKPTSCPNPVNTKKKGVLPVAVLGTDVFDVTTIDPASIRLQGVAPLRYSYEDVTTPVTDGDDCECTTEGPDGVRDLTLKFDSKAIVAALGQVNDGEVLSIKLTGTLKEAFGGSNIEGDDCVVIKAK